MGEIIASDEVAITISNRLGIGVKRNYQQWSQNGYIYLDFDPVRQQVIEDSIKICQAHEVTILNEALVNESRATVAYGGDPVYTLESYLKYLAEKGLVPDNVSYDRAIVAIKSGLVSHWNRAKNEAGSIDAFLKADILARKTRWFTLTYFEELEQGGNMDFRYGILPADLDAEKLYFTSHFITHTCSGNAALSIADAKEIRSDNRNNFSVSSIVGSVARRHNRISEITFIIDTRDLLRAVPVIHGQSTTKGEKEITTHFPVNTGLVRAVVPTYVFDSHQTPKYSSDGTISQEIDPSLLIID